MDKPCHLLANMTGLAIAGHRQKLSRVFVLSAFLIQKFGLLAASVIEQDFATAVLIQEQIEPGL